MLMYWTGGEDYNTTLVQPLRGGAPVSLGAGCLVGSAVWSSDSKRVLFSGDCPDGSGFWLSTLDGRRRRLGDTEQVNALGGVAQVDEWLANPSRLLLSVGLTEGAWSVTVPISAEGAKLTGSFQTVTFGTVRERRASGASNGRLALSNVNSDQRIWSVPINADGHVIGAPTQLTTGPGNDYLPLLSGNGRTLVFASERAGSRKLFCLDLAGGKQRELADVPDVGYVAALSADGARIVVIGPGSQLEEMSTSGGIPTPLGVPSALPWDWSPDKRSLLVMLDDGAVAVVDPATRSTTPFLRDSQCTTWQAHFSRDGRWVVFNGETHKHSHIFVAPFRRSLVPRAEWIPITNGNWDDKPRFSWDDKLIFFTSDRDGYRCIWAQPLGVDMRPAGAPIAVYHSHQSRRRLENLDITPFEMSVGRDRIVFNQAELTGNIWLLEPAKAK